ncbi:MAG: T9SS type A sorting domain-containing protein [Bacteroidia bacterium]|nr:T9SS type A sorting domain-containing protein [Bacteroidia bacterium]
MAKYFFLLIFFLTFISKNTNAQSDTIQTFSYKDSTKRSGVFRFPSKKENYRKVLMLYTLKCYPKVSKYDNKYPCGEWDYLTYTIITDSIGNQIEIARYITPYGINLSLGPNGFTWIYDVTDYLPYLRDSVKLSAGNTQELLDLKFVFVKGTLPAEILKVNQIWDNGAKSYSYSDLSNDKKLNSKSVKIENNTKSIKFRSRITGHGHNSNDGSYPHCCEWKNNKHFLFSGNKKIKEWQIWQTLDCADNPVFPQGGTWPYAREGWCPGDRVKDTEFDITNYKNNDSINLDYRITPVPSENIGMGNGNYVMAMHLIQYGKTNFTNDAEVYDILSPNSAQIFSKFSPSCEEPKIVIRNNSSDTMTSLDIEYNISGGYTMKYKWKGKLGFLQTDNVQLPIFDAGFYRGDGKNTFSVKIINRNGVKDNYEENNILTSKFKMPDIYKDKIYIEFKTNNNPNENKYILKDSRDSIILIKENLTANKVYRDTLKNIKSGCYTFELTDEGTDGLSFWANASQGAGYLRFRKATGTTVLKNFGSDFGYRIYYSFIIDSLQKGIEPFYPEPENGILIYPNPSNGNFTLTTSGISGYYTLQIYNTIGEKIYESEINTDVETDKTINSGEMSSGLHILKLYNGNNRFVKKIIIE